jgi:hypothetical protein
LVTSIRTDSTIWIGNWFMISALGPRSKQLAEAAAMMAQIRGLMNSSEPSS